MLWKGWGCVLKGVEICFEGGGDVFEGEYFFEECGDVFEGDMF